MPARRGWQNQLGWLVVGVLAGSSWLVMETGPGSVFAAEGGEAPLVAGMESSASGVRAASFSGEAVDLLLPEGTGSASRGPARGEEDTSSPGPQRARRQSSDLALPPAPPPCPGAPGSEAMTEEHYEGGALRARGLLVDGQREGRWTEYWEGGEPSSEGEYRSDRRRGGWSFWHESGGVHSSGSYQDGRREGRWVHWHRNGERQAEGTWRSGRREGIWREWYSNGQVKEVGLYVDGRREGYWHFYHFDGSQDLRSGTYEAGRKVREAQGG